jgi:hypothetical protein
MEFLTRQMQVLRLDRFAISLRMTDHEEVRRSFERLPERFLRAGPSLKAAAPSDPTLAKKHKDVARVGHPALQTAPAPSEVAWREIWDTRESVWTGLLGRADGDKFGQSWFPEEPVSPGARFPRGGRS